jgi:ubiquilin
MGPPPGPEEMLRMLDDPNFAQMMNESMNNPAVIQMLETQPMIANNPFLRNMIRNPEMRRMLFSPEMLRAQLQMRRAMGGSDSSFPMPGATDTTPGANTAGTQQGTTGGNAQQAQSPFGNMGMFGFPPATGGAQGNPFAALFGNPPAAGAGTTPTTSPPTASVDRQGTPSTNTDQAQQNPLANVFGGGGGGAGAGSGGNDIIGMAQQMMQNPDMMRAMFGTPPSTGGQTQGQGAGGGSQANPFEAMFNPWGMPNQPQSPPDDRPPEERYAEQLRQLNDMGFFEFERNIQALRRSGGSVQGAIEFLLSGS